ncbi:MAG: hypothetical protein B7Z10_12865, partial [Rhodobacterales bacterium 32-66-7]
LFLGSPGVVSAGVARGWQMAGHEIAAIWYPARLQGSREFDQDRALAAQAPGVSMHGLALRGGVTVRAVPKLSAWPDASAEIAALGVDVVISALYLDIIPTTVLDAFPQRVVNLHPSLLPAYRGRWPVFSMLWDRTIDRFGGMSLHLVTPTIDAGGLLGQAGAAFPADRNLSAYYVRLVQVGTGLLAQKLPEFLAGRLVPAAQPLSDAPQGNRAPQETRLSPDLDWRHVEWLCATIPQISRLRVQGQDDRVTVRSFGGTLGPPRSEPPLRQGDRLEMDTRDARVSLEIG